MSCRQLRFAQAGLIQVAGGNQCSIAGWRHCRRAALVEGNGQGFAQFKQAFLDCCREGAAAAVVDELDDAVQPTIASIDNGRGQNFAGAETGALIHRAQEAQAWINRL